MSKEKTPFKRFPVLSKMLVLLLVAVLVIGLAFGVWAVAYWTRGTQKAPTLEIFTNTSKVWTEIFATPAPSTSDTTATASEPPVVESDDTAATATADEVDNEGPDDAAVIAPDDEADYEDLADEADESSDIVYVTVTPTVAPTAAPTIAPAHATFTVGGNQIEVALLDENGKPVKKKGKQVKQKTSEIRFQIDGKEWVYLLTIEYHGGYFAADDPSFHVDRSTADNGAYGPSIIGNTLQERIYNWLRELCKSPHQIIRLRTQMGLIKPKSISEENRLADELAAKPASEYDEIVNETLVAVYKKLYGGNVPTSYDWDLENYMTLGEGPDETSVPELHGRVNSDKAESKEQKLLLFTLFADDADKTFVSAKQGYLNTADDAKDISGKFSTRAWICPDEGGTWKYKKSGSGGGTTVITTAPPTQEPTVTPAPTSTPKPTPTKDPGQHPTQTDFPVGYGDTSPQNSTEPLRTEAPNTSTPAPEVTAAPVVTAAPTEVPPPVTREPETCSPTGEPLIIAAPQSTTEPGHNVPGQGGSIGGDNNATGDFDVNAQ